MWDPRIFVQGIQNELGSTVLSFASEITLSIFFPVGNQVIKGEAPIPKQFNLSLGSQGSYVQGHAGRTMSLDPMGKKGPEQVGFTYLLVSSPDSALKREIMVK